MFRKREIPVFVFTGFLDGGKTSFIRQTMDEDQFKDGVTTLLLVLEEGEEEIDEKRLKENKFIKRVIEDEDAVTVEKLDQLDKEVNPGRVIIEANGMWDINELFDSFPTYWSVAEIITPVDSGTFEMYLGNMKMMMTNQFLYSDLVVFNRCREDHDRAMFKRMVRAVNKRAQVLYETLEGKVEDNVPEELPYDINKSEIVIEDEDFGIFYIDTLDNLNNYADKTVKFKAMVCHPKDMKAPDMFAVGRNAMTCCAEDITMVGYPCKYDKAKELKNKEWIMLTAKVAITFDRRRNEPMPVLVATKIEKCNPPKEDVVYF